MSYPSLILNEIETHNYTLEHYSSGDDDTDLDYYLDSDSEYALTAQQQWEESMKQITGLVNLVLFPLVGKLLGRRTAHFAWRRFAEWWFI